MIRAAIMMGSIIIYSSCVDQFNFDVSAEEPLLVVDGYLSDISYLDIQDQSMDNRYFDVNLKFTSGVKNIQSEPVTDAEIQVVNDLSESWDYSEIEPGLYRLFFEDFRAEAERAYKIVITLSNNDQYESDFEKLPKRREMAEVFFTEDEILEYVYVAGDVQILKAKGLTLKAKVPALENEENLTNYRWDFNTTYEGIAWGLDEDHINYRCWITSPLFYKQFVIARDRIGGSTHELFFLDSRNQYIHEGFSVLFRQTVLSDDYYQFWQDVENQRKQAELFAPPPYNIISNMHAVDNQKPVYGYFGVVRENFHRWFFSKDEVSYRIIYPNSLQACGSPPAPECFDCRLISKALRSDITNTQPKWWVN